MLWVVQAVLSVIEIAGGFLWGDLFVRERKITCTKKWIFLIGFSAIVALTIFQRTGCMYSRWYLIICITLCSLLGFIIYGRSLRYFFAVAAYYETVYCGDIFCGILLGQLLNDPSFMINQQFHLTVWRLPIYLATRILVIIILFLTCLNRNKIKSYLSLNGNWWYALPLCEHLILGSCDIILEKGNEDLAVSHWIISLIFYSLSVFAFWGYHLYRMRKNLAELVELQRVLYTNGYEEIEKRRFEKEREYHDFKNNLLAIKKMLQDKDYNNLEIFINNLCQPFTAHEILTGMQMIDYVLSVKINSAQSKGISVKAEYANLYPIKNMIELDLAALLGNLWDNSIEGCERCQTPGNIWFYMNNKGHILSIYIKNNCLPLTKKMGLLSMKEDKTNHGIGMRSIQFIVDKYNGNFEWNCENNYFTTSITLYI